MSMDEHGQDDEWTESPFGHIHHPGRRAFLEVYSMTGNKSQAAAAVGIDRSTPWSPPWVEDEDFQASLPLAERMAAELLLEEAWRRGREGVKQYKFTKEGDPIRHPTRCRCGHEDEGHVALERQEPDDPAWGPCMAHGCECAAFRAAPYYEHAYSDTLLRDLLKAYHDRFRDRLEVRGLMGKIDFAQLPAAAINRMAAGEHPLAVLAQLAEGQKAIAPPSREVVQEEPPEL